MNATRTRSSRAHASRRGGIYVLVLSVSAITMSIGLIGLSTLAAQREVIAMSTDSTRAAQLAESAVQLAVHRLAAGNTWRSTPGGEVIAATQLAGGEIRASVSDPADDDLQNDDSQPIVVTGEAVVGQAKRRLSIEFEPATEPLEALDYAIAIREGASGTGNAHITTVVWGVPFRAGRGELLSIEFLYSAANMNWIDQPDPSIVGQYAAMGTPIPIEASKDGNGNHYDGLVLSSTQARSDDLAGFTVDPNGVYVIDADGKNLHLHGGSIEGTVVVINAAGVTVCFQGFDFIRPNSDLFPVILTDGDLKLDNLTATAVTQMQSNADDNGFADPAFNGVSGLVYTSGDVEFTNGVDVFGTVIAAGEAVIKDDVRIHHDGRYTTDPPPGFENVLGLRPVERSWRNLVDNTN